MNYANFLKSKMIASTIAGHEPLYLPTMLFDFQIDITRWAVSKGKAAIFADCGMGKTAMQLAWADDVVRETGGNVLVLAPLAVSRQTVEEGVKFGIDVNMCATQEDVKGGINITNYEKLHHFDSSTFKGVVLDESSIIKHHTSKTRDALINAFRTTPYKLACTATPSPNDFMELGNHAEFLGVMTRAEMLAMFFVHDGGDTAKWRLKGHAQDIFWQWVCSWAVMIRKPSDLGYSDDGFTLPKLNHIEHVVKQCKPLDGMLFTLPAQTLQERRKARKESLLDRCNLAAELAESSGEQWIMWCDLNDESKELTRLINGSVEVKGSDSDRHKINAFAGFSTGDVRVLVSKPKIAGFGMNWQHCHNMAFVGLSDSFESMYQAVRRCWRFGQNMPVNVHVITAESEGAVVANIKRKEADAIKMGEMMVKNMAKITRGNINKTVSTVTEYVPRTSMITPDWLEVTA